MLQSLNILVVEDDLSFQASLVDVLCKSGHLATGIDSAEAFDEEAQDHNIDLVIVDVNLPGEDGFSLVRRLRGVQASLGIIILSAQTDAADKVTGYEAGADMYLTKPVGVEELLAAVNALARRLGTGVHTDRSVGEEPEAIALHTANSSITGRKGNAKLTSTEFPLSSALARAKGKSLEICPISHILGNTDHILKKSLLDSHKQR